VSFASEDTRGLERSEGQIWEASLAGLSKDRRIGDALKGRECWGPQKGHKTLGGEALAKYDPQDKG
jgi:hypothetical protein